MTTRLIEILPLALGVALNPLGITIAIVLSGRPGGIRAGAAYAAGVTGGLALALGLAHLLAFRHFSRRIDDPRIDVAKVDLAVGVVILLWAAWTIYAGRRKSSGGLSDKVLKLAVHLSPLQLIGLGIGQALASGKNLALAGAAGAKIEADQPGIATAVVSLLLFLLVAVAPLLVPLLIASKGGSTANARLDSLNVWVRDHLPMLAGVSLLILGVGLVQSGLSHLLH